jgi:hypothetical protein
MIMEALIRTSRHLIDNVNTDFVRYIHEEISWNSQLVAILGSRGVGKTTLLLQHIKLYDNTNDVLFVTADDFYFTTHRIYDLALEFSQNGGKKLYIDEIHKYNGWSTEIKNIYDTIPDLKIVYTGSSILDLEKGGADLSRRKLEYYMPGLSFREYLNISQKLNLPRYTLDEILAGKVQYPYPDFKPIMHFKKYLEKGYYPFFKDNEYLLRLRGILKQIVEVDIPMFAKMQITSGNKLKKLLYVIAQSSPFKPNNAKLERDLQLNRNSLPEYFEYLEKAGLINLLREKVSGIKILEKVEKVYLNNPNIAYALSETNPDIGNIRETIFFALMRVKHSVSSSKSADFEIGDFTFEIGGKNKKQKQIKGIQNAYIVKDDIEYPYLNTIPLWMFGFIY